MRNVIALAFIHVNLHPRAYARGGLGLKPPLSLIFYKNFFTCANEINYFRILFAC